MILDSSISFKASFSLSEYAELMSLIFEDEKFNSEALLPIVYEGIEKGIELYNKNNRDSDFFTYITYFVKSKVLKYKSENQ